MNARSNLLRAVHLVTLALAASVPVAIKKTRDAREPGRAEKLEAEDEIARVMRRRFRLQARAVRDQLESFFPERKAAFPPTLDIPEDEESEAALILAITRAMQNGIEIFRRQTGIELDFTRPNARALERAREYSYDLIRKIDTTSREMVRSAVSMFVETPGFTIGDLVQQLPFDEHRAEMIAVTETTRAYATGNRLAAQELKENYPDVRVVREWFANNDDRMCPVCGELNGKEVEEGQDFGNGISDPPAHVGCRCWTDYRTRING